MSLILLNPNDDVAIAQATLGAGQEVRDIVVRETIPTGHKIALRDIKSGEVVKKYAQTIGLAGEDIKAGSHVHSHNLVFHATISNYEVGTNLQHVTPVADADRDTFMGFQRDNGKVGTRNYIAIITSVNCSATAARMIADHFDDDVMQAYPNVDGVVAYVHGAGCGMAGSGEGFEALQRLMWGYAKHPNNAAVLMVGLGCEMNQIDWLVEAFGLKRGPLFQTMNIQDVAGLRKTVEMGIEKIYAMLPEANKATRTPCPASELTVALQCGGSDAWSGVTANPALGYACDLLVRQGGTGVLAETPEIYGAEHLLTQRAQDDKTAEDLLKLIRWWEDYTARNQGSMDNNPSPGNKQGGLTTILEKSLGAAAKGGTSPLMGVFKYAQTVDRKGFVFMDSPGYDPVSVTGQIASGCNLVVFTTGRGSAFGSKPAPCIKVATNTRLYDRMQEDMDVNAGAMLSDNKPLEAMGKAIYDLFLRIASGEQTKSEAQGLGDFEFVPWQIGATM